MKLEQLIYLITVAETKSISKAALQLHISQPSISVAIADLESELGQKLFERFPHGTFICDDSENILEEAKNILNSIEKIKSMCARTAANKQGMLSIATLPSIESVLLDDIIFSFNQKYPDIHISSHTVPSDLGIKMLFEGSVDISTLSFYGNIRLPEDTYMQVPLIQTKFIGCIASGQKLAKEGEVYLEDLRKIILVNALNNVLFSGIHKPILDIITHTTQLLQTKSHHSMLRMCARGLGVAILPEFIFDHFSSEFSKKLTKLKIKNSLQPIEYRTVYLKSRPHSEELSYFIEVMKYFSGDHKAEI